MNRIEFALALLLYPPVMAIQLLIGVYRKFEEKYGASLMRYVFPTLFLLWFDGFIAFQLSGRIQDFNIESLLLAYQCIVFVHIFVFWAVRIVNRDSELDDREKALEAQLKKIAMDEEIKHIERKRGNLKIVR